MRATTVGSSAAWIANEALQRTTRGAQPGGTATDDGDIKNMWFSFHDRLQRRRVAQDVDCNRSGALCRHSPAGRASGRPPCIRAAQSMAKGSTAFVFLLHFPPGAVSNLTKILQTRTDLPVERIEDGVRVKANVVYVMAPGHDIVVRDGALYLEPFEGRSRAEHHRPSFLLPRSGARRAVGWRHPLGRG